MLDATEKQSVNEKAAEQPVDNSDEDDDDDQPTPEEVEILAEIAEQEQEEKPVPKQGSPMYQHYMSIQAQYPTASLLTV